MMPLPLADDGEGAKRCTMAEMPAGKRRIPVETQVTR